MTALSSDPVPAGDANGLRAAGRAVLAFSVLFPLVEVWRLAVLASGTDLAIGIVATAAYLPLHLRHVRHGLHGRRPRAAVTTLGLMAFVIVTAWWLIGSQWVFMFASLAVSALCALPTLPALTAAAAVVGWPLLVYAWSPGLADGVYSGPYLTLSLLFRATSLFIVIWLVAASRRLAVVRAALADSAVHAERAALQSDLRTQLGGVLDEVATLGARAETLAARRDPNTTTAIGEVVRASRAALNEVTRLVDGYQRVAAQAELKAAASLLTDAGLDVELLQAARVQGQLVLTEQPERPAGGDSQP